MLKKILVALDSWEIDVSGSDHSELSRSERERSSIRRHVFDEAVSAAKANNARLLLLHVLSEEEEELVTHSDLPSEEFKRQCLEPLHTLEKFATDTGIDAKSHYDSGEPGVTICQWAEDWDADLIIMGRRSLSRLQEMLLGSVSNYVLHHAPCSVFIAHLKSAALEQKV